ncbi:hypothetical protein niasHT_030736 [Heterodera trifolii]|uniref:Uncharacterized protein n=1 Tax=Heterodera trifolii TaxID=157864 RepID=A0ABD2HUQ6_9BILA
MTSSLADLDAEWATYKTEFETAEAEHVAYNERQRENVNKLKQNLALFSVKIDRRLEKGELSDDDKRGLEALNTQAEQMHINLSHLWREEAVERLKTLYANARRSSSWESVKTTASLARGFRDPCLDQFLAALEDTLGTGRPATYIFEESSEFVGTGLTHTKGGSETSRTHTVEKKSAGPAERRSTPGGTSRTQTVSGKSSVTTESSTSHFSLPPLFGKKNKGVKGKPK